MEAFKPNVANLQNVSGNQAVGHKLNKSTRTPTAHYKKQTSVGHHSAQTHLPWQLYKSLFFAQTSHQPHRQFTKTILFFKLTAQKADARFLLKVLV